MTFKEKFGKEILFFDGAMGTMLQKNGLKTGELPENMNITHPDVLLKIHKEYLDAGCNVITTNTFGANSLKFNNVEEIITSAVSLAKKSAEDYDRDTFVMYDQNLQTMLDEINAKYGYEVSSKEEGKDAA